MSTTLPLFPLTTALVPGLMLPLHIFEPRYRGLVEDLLAIDDEEAREFGIVAVRDGRSIEADGQAALYEIGTATVLREAERLPDGRFDIVTTGSRRFRIDSVDFTMPLAIAQVTFLEDSVDSGDDTLAQSVRRRFAAYRAALSGQLATLAADAGDDLPDDPVVISYLVTAAMVLPTAERQQLLSSPTTGDRLRLARELLQRETALVLALRSLPAIEPLAPRGSLN